MSDMYVNGPLPTSSAGASNFQHVSNASSASNGFLAHEASNSTSRLTGNNFGGNGYRGKGNGGYKSKFNGNRSGSWSGNNTNRPNVIPECHMCL